MHPITTQNDFLRLRVQGQSLASIGRQLRVSKPTLIKWSRQAQNEIHARVLAERMKVHDDIATAATDELAALQRLHSALKQELLSRSLRDVPTAHLESLTGEIRQRIESLSPSSPSLPITPVMPQAQVPLTPDSSRDAPHKPLVNGS